MKMLRLTMLSLLVAALALTVAGCSGPIEQVVKSDELLGQMMEKITGDPAMAADVVQRLLGSEDTQRLVLDQVLQNTDAARSLMSRVAGDQTMVDGILNLSVQDPAMKEHLMTLLKGMQMASK